MFASLFLKVAPVQQTEGKYMARKLLVKDTAAMAQIINKMDIREDMTQLIIDVTSGEKGGEELGVNLIFMLIEGACKKGVIEDLYSFIGSVIEIPGEEVAELPLEDLIEKLKEVADAESWTSFFKTAVRSIITR